MLPNDLRRLEVKMVEEVQLLVKLMKKHSRPVTILITIEDFDYNIVNDPKPITVSSLLSLDDVFEKLKDEYSVELIPNFITWNPGYDYLFQFNKENIEIRMEWSKESRLNREKEIEDEDKQKEESDAIQAFKKQWREEH